MTVRAYAIASALLTFLAGTAAVARADCKPAAIPVGEATLVQSVSERLAANGVSTIATAGCPAVRVHLERRGEQLHLRVADGYQRRGEREVQDIATAAAVIESWTLQEIEEGSMPADAPSAAPLTPVTTPPRWFGIGASFRTALTEQSSTWIGGTISGCARVGRACIGARFGVAKDLEATGTTSSDDYHPMQLDALATAEVPRSLGAFVISPGLSVGYGWQRISSTHLDIHMEPFTLVESSHALIAGLHVRIARPVAQHISMFAELGADRSLARTGPTVGPATWFGASLGARFGSP